MLTLTAVATAALGLYVLLWAALRLTHSSKEPKAVATGLPFISPLIGLVSRGLGYFVYLRDTYPLPIYTLRLPGIRLYVVNATSLIPAVQRPAETLAWSPIVIKVANNVMALSKPTMHLLEQDLRGSADFLTGLHRAMHLSLSPGTAALEKMNKIAVASAAASVTKLAASGKPFTVPIYKFLGHEALMPITDAIFGPRNPFHDAAVEASYDIWEPNFINMWMGIAPYVAKNSLKAREHLVTVYRKYFNDKAHMDEDTSELIRLRHEFYISYGIPREEIAQIEVTLTFTLLGNARPVIFWLVWHIAGNPALLTIVRDELNAAMATDAQGARTLDMASLKDRCPTLYSTYLEILRYHGINISIREVVDDYVLDGQYLLKKGNFIMTPGSVQHSTAGNWGDNVDAFYPQRFKAGEPRYNRAAFRGFGGGANLCPGRHFASCGLMAAAAMLLLKFDVRPVSGRWEMPSVKKSNPATAVSAPDEDMEFEFTPRGEEAWTAVYTVSGKAGGVFAEGDKAEE